jgi:hypothetical protein
MGVVGRFNLRKELGLGVFRIDERSALKHLRFELPDERLTRCSRPSGSLRLSISLRSVLSRRCRRAWPLRTCSEGLRLSRAGFERACCHTDCPDHCGK